jgi:hypothetical protein
MERATSSLWETTGSERDEITNGANRPKNIPKATPTQRAATGRAATDLEKKLIFHNISFS